MPLRVASSETVSIVDDNPATRAAIAAVVRSLGLEAKEYATAWEFLEDEGRFGSRSQSGDLRSGCLIVESQMPGLSALDLFKSARRGGVRLPTIVLASSADIPSTVRILRAGAIVVEKPFSESDLAEAIRRAAASAGGGVGGLPRASQTTN